MGRQLQSSQLRTEAFAAHRAGRFQEALDRYAEAERAATAPGEIARIKAGQASSHWARGETDLAADLATEARELAERAGDGGALAEAWVATALVLAAVGDRLGNARAYETALVHAEAAAEHGTTIRVLANQGSQLVEEGRFTEALTKLENALTLVDELSEDTSSAALTAALTHQNVGEAYLGLGRLEEALHEFRIAESSWLEQDSPMRAHAELGIGDAYRLRGLPTQAAAAYRDAIAIAEVSEAAQVLAPALAGLARVRVEDDPLEARAALARSLQTPAALGRVAAHLAAGWLELDAGDLSAASEHARLAEAEAGRRRSRPGLAGALELLALVEPSGARSRLVEAAEIWADVGDAVSAGVNTLLQARSERDRDAERDARRTLHGLGISDAAVRIAGPLRAIGDAPDAEIHVRVLGRLAVLRHGEPLPVWAWQSRKCRDVVKILAARPRGIGRDELAELLWPDTTSSGSRLSVVLSTLRTLLDPEREHGPDHIVVADRSTVRFNPETVEVDAVELERRATAALRARGRPEQAIARLEEVAASITGRFAEDDPYAEWAAPARDRLDALTDQVRRTLADALSEAGRPAAAVPWYLALIAADPYDEAAHRGLLRALHADRRHGQVRRHYAEYQAAMADLGEPAAPLTAMLADDART